MPFYILRLSLSLLRVRARFIVAARFFGLSRYKHTQCESRTKTDRISCIEYVSWLVQLYTNSNRFNLHSPLRTDRSFSLSPSLSFVVPLFLCLSASLSVSLCSKLALVLMHRTIQSIALTNANSTYFQFHFASIVCVCACVCV